MAYIGNRPEQGNFRKCDAITTSATATYNLLVGGVAVNPNQNQCIVSLNGVIQSSGNSYTIASSQITFASALTSSDVIDFILILGDTLNAGIPSDSSVGLAQLSATGSPSSSNFLRGDNSWQTVSAGTSLSGSTDNTVTTVTGANAIQGEANLTFDGNEMTVQGTPVVVGTNSSAVLDLKNTASSADGTAVGIAFSTNTGGSANAHITAVQDANAKGTLNFGGYDGTSTRNIVMSVDAGNNIVGIANTTPSSYTSGFRDLVVGNSASGKQSGITIGCHSGQNANLVFSTGTSGDALFKGRIMYDATTNAMRFFTDGDSERLRIDSAGVAKVNNRLVIDNNVDSIAKLNIEYGGNNENGFQFNDKDGASSAKYMGFSRSGTQIGQIQRNGSNDSINYVTSSDYRLKDGVVDKTDGIEKIKLLKPRKFYWKSNTDKTLVDGFLAHEVSDIVPEAISGEKDAMIPEVLYTADDELPEGKNIGDVKEATKINPQGIDQSKLVPLLTSALQEAITKIETLETENTDIKARLTALENA